jgi:hypothetical protein
MNMRMVLRVTLPIRSSLGVLVRKKEGLRKESKNRPLYHLQLHEMTTVLECLCGEKKNIYSPASIE